jgi:hypothetical protein
MAELVERACAVDVDAAVDAVREAAVGEAGRQADRLLGGRPLPGTPQWEDERGERATERDLATQLLQLRIELTVGLDPFGTVLGLRRSGATWGLIARAAGVTRQAAHERWGRRVLATLDRYGTGELGGAVPDDEADLPPARG